jgi:hypothetical protein
MAELHVQRRVMRECFMDVVFESKSRSISADGRVLHPGTIGQLNPLEIRSKFEPTRPSMVGSTGSSMESTTVFWFPFVASYRTILISSEIGERELLRQVCSFDSAFGLTKISTAIGNVCI